YGARTASTTTSHTVASPVFGEMAGDSKSGGFELRELVSYFEDKCLEDEVGPM
ncbi:hypothetical protein STEG23_018846, partial [Scotinomys teguina]